jgi:Ni/Co efflux regulator RcnB
MKRLFVAAAAAMTLVGPMAGVASAAPYDRGHNERRDNDRRDNDRRDNDRRDNGRWDQRQYNGYNYRGRWYYGAPSAQIMRDRTYSPGYHSWRRGDRLSAYERAHYRQVDYRRDRLRAPPRGYQYVRSDRGELLLVGIATGVILSVLASQ